MKILGKNILLLKKTRVLLKKKFSRLLLKKCFEQKYDFFLGTFAQKHKIKSCVNRVLKYALQLQWEITHETPAAALWTKLEAFENMRIYGASVLQKETLGGGPKHG